MNDFLVLSLPAQVGHVRTTELVYHCIKQMAIFVAVRDRTKETIVKTVSVTFSSYHLNCCSMSTTTSYAARVKLRLQVTRLVSRLLIEELKQLNLLYPVIFSNFNIISHNHRKSANINFSLAFFTIFCHKTLHEAFFGRDRCATS